MLIDVYRCLVQEVQIGALFLEARISQRMVFDWGYAGWIDVIENSDEEEWLVLALLCERACFCYAIPAIL